jgi:hypothetical protein
MVGVESAWVSVTPQSLLWLFGQCPLVSFMLFDSAVLGGEGEETLRSSRTPRRQERLLSRRRRFQ